MFDKRLVILPILLVVCGGLYFGLGRGVVVEVASVTRGAAVDMVYATGSIEPVVQADVAPEVTARLAELLVDEGQAVVKGAPLAKLESAEQAAEVAQFSALVKNDQIDLSRAETLWTKKSGSREDFDRAASVLAQDEAKLAGAKERLARRVIAAPIAGVVLRRDGEVGEMLTQGKPLFTLGQPGALRATLDVDEEDLPQVKLGQKALLSADAFPGKVFTGEVSEITPKGDSLNKSYRVRVKLPPDFVMPIGMTVEANLISLEKQNVLLVPATAMTKDGVFVVTRGRAVLYKVETGITGAVLTEIISGVTEGDQVVRQPAADLQDGARVHAGKK